MHPPCRPRPQNLLVLAHEGVYLQVQVIGGHRPQFVWQSGRRFGRRHIRPQNRTRSSKEQHQVLQQESPAGFRKSPHYLPPFSVCQYERLDLFLIIPGSRGGWQEKQPGCAASADRIPDVHEGVTSNGGGARRKMDRICLRKDDFLLRRPYFEKKPVALDLSLPAAVK